MMGRTHAISGAAAWLALAPMFDAPVSLVASGAIVCAVGALVPDLDEPGAKLSRTLGPLRRPVCMTIRRLAGGHRHGTHYLITALIVGYLLHLWHPWVGYAIGLGMATHSLGDMLTVEGVRWFWPLPWVTRGPFHTGQLAEKLAIAPLLTLVVAALAWTGIGSPAWDASQQPIHRAAGNSWSTTTTTGRG